MAKNQADHSTRGATSPQLLGQVNDRIVLELLIDHGPMTRGQIGEHTGLSKPTVSALLERLNTRGLVEYAGSVPGGPGPKAKLFQLNATAGLVAGIHIEQYGCTAALASLTGEILCRSTVEIPDRAASNPRDEVRRAIDGLLAAGKVAAVDIDRIMLATPGVIDPASGTLRHAQHLQGWEEPGLRDTLAHDLGIPIDHGNDVNLTALAEGHEGAAIGYDDYALIWLDRGVGLGIVTRGRLHTGAHGGAGEIGYLPSPGFADAPLIADGEAGAFQQLVGGQGIRQLAVEHRLATVAAADSTTLTDIVTCAINGGPDGDAFLDELARRIAAGAAAVATLLDPGLIVLGGAVATAGGQRLLAGVRRNLTPRTFVPPDIAVSEIEGDGVLVGAIQAALRRLRANVFGRSIAASGPDDDDAAGSARPSRAAPRQSSR